jgi:uncharacterized protein (DUF885 family)
MTQAPTFTVWLDDFFASYYRHRPVNATFIGVHEYDQRLPDYSESGLGDALADAEALLARLRELPAERLSAAEATDRGLAEGFLEIQRWELASAHFQRGNPTLFTSEAAFGVISLLRRPFAPVAQRLEAAIARMEAIPPLLAQGRELIRAAPAAWIERAADECAGLRKLFGEGIDLLIAEHAALAEPVRRAADRATIATAVFQQFLETELRGRANQRYACGAEAFDLLLRRGHFLAVDAVEVERYAEEQFVETEAYLSEHARDVGADTWQAALAHLADLHPSAGRYYARYGELWDDCRAAAEEQALLTWPDYPIRYAPRPAWARAAAPHLYFLFYHSPAPYDGLPEVEYLVTPIEPEMAADERDRLLRANNDSVIKLNHVVHHGAIGHHVQNWHAFRAESRIGQVAAVDCASRIAMFCGGTMAEGWACYATDLMAEIGFLTPLERFAERHTRLRMAARALADVRLHHGIWSLDQTAEFYQRRVGMAPAAARGEAVKNSMFPGTALMYLMGTDAIHQLRRELATRPGFQPRAFHDQLLSYGSIPVALAAESMRGAF